MKFIRSGSFFFFFADWSLFLFSFYTQGVVLTHNASARVIRSNQSLVLQRVTRHSAGNYSCSAINAEGETVSNQLELRVKCKYRQFQFLPVSIVVFLNIYLLSVHLLLSVPYKIKYRRVFLWSSIILR